MSAEATILGQGFVLVRTEIFGVKFPSPETAEGVKFNQQFSLVVERLGLDGCGIEQLLGVLSEQVKRGTWDNIESAMEDLHSYVHTLEKKTSQTSH